MGEGKSEAGTANTAMKGNVIAASRRVTAAKDLIETPRTATHASVFEKHKAKPMPNKFNDLCELWGKNSIGFAGPNLGSNSRLSKGEAQATLQRMIVSSGAIDFNEV